MSNIKIQDVAQRIQYVATNLQTVYSVPYPFFATTDLVVYQGSTVLNLGAAPGEYGVSGAGSPSGGSVTLVTGATTGDIITITDNLAIDRTSIYSATISNLSGSDLNGDFNREVVMLKQIETKQDLMQLQYYPYAEVSQDPTVTIDRWLPQLAADQLWAMNTANTAIIAVNVPAGGIGPADATFITQTPSADLSAEQALSLSATGFMASATATGVVTTRILTGTTNQINIANGDGSGVPTFTLSSTLDTPGTFTVGTSIVIDSIINDLSMVTAAANNVSSSLAMKTYVDNQLTTTAPLTTKGDLLGFSTLDVRVPIGTVNGQMLQVASGAAPGLEWSTASYPVTATNAGRILRSDGTNYVDSTSTFADTYAASTLLYSNTANTVEGLATANSALLVTDSTGVPAMTASLTNGQIIIGSTGAAPTPSTLTAGTGITIGNTAGTITISSGGAGYSWTEVTGTTQTMVASNGYILNNAGLVTATLPVTAAVGDTLILQGKGAGLYRIAQNAAQTIHFGSSDTTTGVGGYIEATNRYDSIELVCITANSDWAVLTGPQGSLTIV